MIIAIVQARLGSTRFPNKTLKEINGKSLIEIQLYRLSKSKRIEKIIVATTTNEEDNILCSAVEKLGYEVFRGNEEDVLDRYYNAAQIYNPSIIVRSTGDCPLIDHEIVDEAIDKFKTEKVDYLNNVTPPKYPDGLDIEIFSFELLKEAWEKTVSKNDKEHVSSYMRKNDSIKKSFLVGNKDYGSMRLTVDEPDDFKVISEVINNFWPNLDFSFNDIVNLEKSNPSIFKYNNTIARDEGSKEGTGQKLWVRAKHLIPGGNMLLSKRAEMFLPDKWPAYFSKSKGYKVWDLDNNEYNDMSIMGIGTNTLGYGHPEVDEAVRKTIDKGNMSTFNCSEEVLLAEKLVSLHPWADMVRFARSGGEVNAIAMRIARAASGKDKVAICGYHGWHDWYLSANLGDESTLDGHLLPGLEPRGVPRNLKGTTLPFRYNNYDELEKLVEENPDIGVIKTEVQRNEEPKNGFLEKIRKLADRKNIVLIFDECTSGFRETFGGLHKKYNVEPDMAVFGKALGNGYAVTAVAGKRSVMEAAQDTFISSTFWTERIGSSAALKTLEVMKREQSWNKITDTGKAIQKRWKDLGSAHNLKLNVSGLAAISSFSFHSKNNLKYKTLITQEMLKSGFLASNLIFVCTEHTEDLIDNYFEELDKVFAIIKKCEENNSLIDELLEGPVCHQGFKRLN